MNTNSSSPSRGSGHALLAAACGITVGNVYLCQPLLEQIASQLGVAPQTASLVAVAAQVGYALGILFVLPLADVLATRRLVRVLLALTSLFLLAAGAAPGITALIGASAALATTTVIPQILIPVLSGQAAPAQRARMIGTLQTGLILGILLSRTGAGALAELSGSWRWPYLLAALLTASLLLAVPRRLPAQRPAAQQLGYGALLRSLPPLCRHRALRLSMAMGFLIFAAFSVFWATLAFHLASPAFGLGPAVAGLFGLFGAPGAILAPRFGRLADRLGAARVNALALAAVLAALLLAATLGAWSLVALVLAVNLLDFGLQSGQIANQTRIFALGDAIRARVNTLYMVATFSGGAAGSLSAALAWRLGGWQACCLLAVALCLLAGMALAAGRRPMH